MAMLAAPRRKQKVINLRAKNNAWSNDSSKFGQRMLEKMGWSSGKGLGAKENGIVEHVVARYKNDEKGLGFEDKNDQWTKHEDDFNALLANLSNADGTEEKLHSGVSLEVKSKKSKARVHYHKYTRGKDLTRYSEKDLANIFGKKTLKEEEKPVESIQEDIKSTEQVFTEKGSMEDYFKSKLAKFKSQSNLFSSKNDSGDNAEYAFKGFANNADENDEENGNQETHQGFGFSFYNTSIKETDNVNSNSNEVSETVEETQKVKKKKKKNKNKQDLVESICENDVLAENTNVGNCEQDDVFDEPKPDKKSKKKKKLKEEPLEDIQPDELKPKKKSKVNKDSSTQDSMQDTQDVEEENYVPIKKKKRKNKDVDK